MTVIKNQKSNTYEVRTYYKDWTGVRKQKTKRGFKRKCDAQEWERAFKLKENLSLDMYFEDFVDLYLNDIKSRIKYNTWLTKKHIVEKKILPYFSKKKLQEIKPSDIRQWQNTMMNYRNKQGEGYSQVYLKTIHNQLSAILNHAVNFYDLKSNAARKAGSMGKERTKEMDKLLKEDIQMVKKIDSYKKYKKVFWGVGISILSIVICVIIYLAVCTVQHNKMYDKVLDAGFEKELTEDFIEKYQGYYALTEDGVDYLVEPKAIGKYELDNKNFVLVARKGEQDITLMIDENKKITLALYPGRIEIDQEGKQVNVTENMTDEQRKRENELLSERKEELMPILHKALELWEAINN